MIAVDDTRHGHRAGYLAGCDQECCRTAAYRAVKQARLRRLQDGPQLVPSTTTRDRLTWWGARGVGHGAVATAAGLSDSTLSEIISGSQDQCRRSTERAVLAITWDHLAPRTRCYADLTRARVGSLMAAGHSLRWICDRADGLAFGGNWRHQDTVYLATARGVLDVYRSAALAGPSAQTATKARNAGHRHPLAWDDPETPAEPPAWVAAAVSGEALALTTASPDAAVVDRILGGEHHLPCTPAEKGQVCARWVATGRSLNELARLTGWRVARYYQARRSVA